MVKTHASRFTSAEEGKEGAKLSQYFYREVRMWWDIKRRRCFFRLFDVKGCN